MDWPELCSIPRYDVGVAFLLLFGTWLTYMAVKPLLSPLRKIPGMPYKNPFLGDIRYLLSGESMNASLSMIKKYGPVVRFYFPLGRTVVLVADPEIMKHICIGNSQNYVKPYFGQLVSCILGNGLVSSEGAVHAVHKRLLSPSFNSNSIAKKMMPIVQSKVQKLAGLWYQSIQDGGGHAVLPIHDDLQRTTLDIVGLTAFGFEFNCLTQPDHRVSVAFHSILAGIGLTWRFVIPYYYYFPVPEMIRFRRQLRIVEDVVFDIISQKRKLISEGADLDQIVGDVLGMMMIARDEETGLGLSDNDLRDHVVTLLLAGHETSAVGMAWCLLMMATHPDVQAKARSEIMSVCDSDGCVSNEECELLEYCGCVIKESLRLYPPVPVVSRKLVDDDVLPGGYFIPAKTVVHLALGPMMRREEIYQEADKFKPERFLDSSCTTDANSYKFAPFVFGSRQCLGIRFAMIEMKMMLAILLRKFHFEIDPSVPHFKRRFTATMRPDPSLKLRVTCIG